jgi:hypothetical protein
LSIASELEADSDGSGAGLAGDALSDPLIRPNKKSLASQMWTAYARAREMREALGAMRTAEGLDVRRGLHGSLTALVLPSR